MIKKLGKKGKNFINLIKAKWANWQHRNKVKDKPVENVFTYIYESNYWGDPESASGAGSNQDQTKVIVTEIPKILKKYQVNSMLDLPCGDFNWMRRVDLSGINYTGGDIVEAIIAKNQSRYGRDTIQFKKLDIISGELPKVDLVFCRDCFIHLSNEQVLASIQNLKKHNIHYLLTTSHTDRKQNTNILAGEWRPINLQIAPFHLNAMEIINENCTEDEGRRSDKSLILVDLTK